MNANYRRKTTGKLLIVLSGFLVVASCAGGGAAYKKGTKAEIVRDYDAALEQYRQATLADPTNVAYKLKYDQIRFSAAYTHFQAGRRALDAGDAVKAQAEFAKAAEIDPSHDFAKQELQDVNSLLAARGAKGVEPILNFDKMQAANRTDANLGAGMKTNLKERISVRMTASSRTIFENLASQAGLQVIFGRNYRPQNATIDLQDVNIFEALDLVSLQTTSFWQPVNENTILVMEDTQQNRRDFEDHILKTIYLTNITSTNDLNGILNVLRTALGLRGIFQSEQQNAIVIHDTPARVAMAENVIHALDKAKAEVIIDVTVMEVDRNLLRDLGIGPPSASTIGFNPPGATATTTTNDVTLRGLDKVNSGNFTVSVADSIANFLASHSNASLIQNPRLRTTDGVTASLRVGSEVPVPTTSFQSTNIGGGATTSYTLQQVGVQLDIVSKVLLNREVSLAFTVTVRALAGERKINNETSISVFSNRIVAHTIRLAEGETNILGGIISKTESDSMAGIPGLKDIPFLKFIFGSEHKTQDEAEVIIMLTPHIIRMPNITEDDVRGIIVGGENNLRMRPDYGTPAALPAVPAPRPTAPPPPTSALPTVTPGPATTATVNFAPSAVTLASQGQTDVSLSIAGGSSILGADLTLSYDPSAFTIKDVHEGGYLSGTSNQVIALVHNIDNQKGIAKVTLERQPTAGLASGDGTLMKITLQPGAKKGPSTLRVTEFSVRDQRQSHAGKSAEAQITVP